MAEFIGTFGIVFAPVTLSAAGKIAGGDPSLMASAWASGLSVLAMIYALGHISAAQFNPAVTVAFAAAGRFPWRYVLPYIAAQFAGSVAASLLVRLLFGSGDHGVHVPAFPALRALLLEATLTFWLMLVIISVATDKRANGAVPGLAIGLTVVCAVLIGGPVTGGSMNPARSFGPALVSGGAALPVWWIYGLGPMIGAILAARVYEALRGGEEHSHGAPQDLYVARKAVQKAPTV